MDLRNGAKNGGLTGVLKESKLIYHQKYFLAFLLKIWCSAKIVKNAWIVKVNSLGSESVDSIYIFVSF